MRLCHPFKKISTFKKFSSCSLCPSTVEVKEIRALYRKQPRGSCGPWMGFWIAHYVSYIIVNGLLSLPQGSYFISHDFERDFQNVNLPKLTTFSEVVCIINGWLLLLFTFWNRYRRRLFVSDWLPLISLMSVEDKVISALALTLDADVCLGIEENITFVEEIRQKHTSQLTQCTMSIVARCEVLKNTWTNQRHGWRAKNWFIQKRKDQGTTSYAILSTNQLVVER